MELLDGRFVASQLSEKLHASITAFRQAVGVSPSLVALRVGEHPPSLMYLRQKEAKAKALGIDFRQVVLPENVTSSRMREVLTQLNEDLSVHGIILQLPLPKSLDSRPLLEHIDPLKDVDGLHPFNQGKLLADPEQAYVPCTPMGCLKLVHAFGFSLKGAHCVVVGRSVLVGKPLSLLLLHQNATVTVCHSHTTCLETRTREADFLFVAMGSPHHIQGHYVKPGACVIDIGIQRVNGTLKGDVHFDEVAPIAGALSPVPGGVGPLTVLCLMENTFKAAQRQCRKMFPPLA